MKRGYGRLESWQVYKLRELRKGTLINTVFLFQPI